MNARGMSACMASIIVCASCKAIGKMLTDESTMTLMYHEDSKETELAQIRTNGIDVVAWGTGSVELNLKLPFVDPLVRSVDIPDDRVLVWNEKAGERQVTAIDLEKMVAAAIPAGLMPEEKKRLQEQSPDIRREVVRILDASLAPEKDVVRVFVLPKSCATLFDDEQPHPTAILFFSDDPEAEAKRVQTTINGELFARMQTGANM